MPMTPDPHGRRCLVVAEIAQAHDGSLGTAHAFIDAVADAGADAVKFQTHIARAESTRQEPWRVKFSYQDATRYDYWRRMEFTEDQWRGLERHAVKRGLFFLSSPFSIEAVELLSRVGVAAWKIASGEVSSADLFARIAETRLPVLLSTGMSGMAEIDEAVARIRRANLPFTVFQCTTLYPTPPEKVGLNLLALFRDRYGCAVGLSDHSGAIFPSLAAAALGAGIVEVHVAFSRQMFGPDVPASVTVPELAQLVEGVRFTETMRSHPLEKDRIAAELAPVRALFTKSLALREDLPAGTLLKRFHLTAKKPGSGISPERMDDIVGKRLVRDVSAEDLLRANDLEPVDMGDDG